MKHFFSLLLIFFLGGVGGIFLDRIALPELSATALGKKFPALRRISERTTIVNKTEVVRIEESEAIPDLADRVKNAVVPIEATRRVKLRARGTTVTSVTEVLTGLSFTSDGLILLPIDEEFSTSTLSLIDGERKLLLEFVASDTSTEFALLRAPASRLSVLPFADDTPRLGSRLFVLSARRIGSTIAPFFRASMLSTLTNSFFTLSEPPPPNAVVVNFKGEVVGMSIVRDDGNAVVVSADELRRIGDELLHKKQ